MNRGARWNVAPIQNHRDHLGGQKPPEPLIDAVDRALRKIPEHPGVQLFFVQCGLEIQRHGVRPLLSVHVGAGAEYGGA